MNSFLLNGPAKSYSERPVSCKAPELIALGALPVYPDFAHKNSNGQNARKDDKTSEE